MPGVMELRECEKCGFQTWHKLTADGWECEQCRKRKEKQNAQK